MLSEQPVLGMPKVNAITCGTITYLGLHILSQGQITITHNCPIYDIADVVMAKEAAKGNYTTEQLKLSLTTPLQLSLFHHLPFVNRLWEDYIRHTQNRTSNSNIRIFGGLPTCAVIA